MTREVFEAELEVVERYGFSVEWKVFDLSWNILLARNEARREIDPSHCQPEYAVLLAYEAFLASGAWWRSLPADGVELTKP